MKGKKIVDQSELNKSEASKCLFVMTRQSKKNNKDIVECNAFLVKMEIQK